MAENNVNVNMVEINVENLKDSIEFDDIDDIETPGRPPVLHVDMGDESRRAIQRNSHQPQQ